MGSCFNPDNESFRMITNSEIYIDKTGLLDILNERLGTEQRCIALSHARRFGKSQAAGMIDAYYSCGSDSKELFDDFEIAKKESYEKYLNKYNVIHIDMSLIVDFNKTDVVATIVQKIVDDIREVYGNEIDYTKNINLILGKVYQLSGKPFVFVIDEWDAVIRNFSDRQDIVHEYLRFLHAIFKSEESRRFLVLGYITGILPLKKLKDESALNNFTEYTMLSSKAFTKYYGFTEKEVKSLCTEYNMEFDSMRAWYDGYRIDGIDMYNPNSVVMAIMDKSISSYWRNTSVFDTITDFVMMDFDGLKQDVKRLLAGEKIRVNTLKFKNDLSEINSKDDVFTALIHLGYLGYDNGKAYIPNYEVAQAYDLALQNNGWTDVANSLSLCEELLDETINGNNERVAEIIELAHETYTSVLQYNDENSLSCVLTMAYYTAPAYYNIIREMPAGKGFADFIFYPRKEAGNRPALIVELKYDKNADTALKQIKEKRYSGALKEHKGRILLVGVSYDKNNKKHECIIEELQSYS